MKAYEFTNGTLEFDYPDDMKQILCYLQANGSLNVSEKTVEKLYREFCHSAYAAGWMQLDEDRLKEFADWLSDYDI